MVQAVSHPLPISRALGDLISEVVREFARSQGLGPEGYDLWYHDEPVWLVRHDEDTPRGRLARRVQVCAFDTGNGPQLCFIPDSFLYDPKKKAIVKKASPEECKKGSQRADVVDLRYSKEQEAKRKLTSALEEAWKAAQAISL